MTSLRTLEVILTAQCNLSCSYCYQNDKKARHMEWPTLRTALDKLLSSPAPQVTVLFIGGEPLLQLPLIRRAADYVEQSRSPSQAVAMSLSTNGLLLDEDASRFLDTHGFRVQLSFDGVPAAQNLRGVGTHAAIDRLIDRLQREHPTLFRERFRVAVTAPVSTIHHIADSVSYLIDKGVPTISLEPAILQHESWSPAHHEELERQFERMFEQSVRHFELTGDVPVECFRKTAEASHHRPRGRSLCGVGGGEAIAVDVDGEVSGCVTFADSYQKLPEFLEQRIAPTRMGHIGAPDLDDRLARYPKIARAAAIFDNQQDKHSSYGHCADCRHLGECSICPVTIGYQADNHDPDRIPDFACAFNLISLDYKARFPRQPNPAEILRGDAALPAWMRVLERGVSETHG